jgi:hypothetical protein
MGEEKLEEEPLGEGKVFSQVVLPSKLGKAGTLGSQSRGFSGISPPWDLC